MTPTKSPLFWIVVRGQMNPPIHHPFWYFGVDVISEAERDAAVADSQSLFGELSQFKTTAFEIFCSRDRFEIKTRDRGTVERVSDVARALFDEKLPHTPVSALGLNTMLFRDIGHSSSEALARIAKSSSMDFGLAEVTSASLRLVCSTKDRTESVEVSPGQGSMIRLTENVHYSFAQQQGRFELGPILATYSEVVAHAEQRADLIAAQLNKGNSNASG
ncbi:MAG: hypothetical protein HYS13_12700 [Planctomycetia bacterium]|nr:hypothetical protein [Planctomycetia bacterium]